MRSYLIQATNWMVALAILCQGVAFAETAHHGLSSAKVEKASVFRHSSYPAALSASQKSNRPILIYVGMPRCPHCVKMLNKTYERSAVGNLVSGSFESVYVGRYTHAKLVERLKVRWYPTTVLVGPNNRVLDMIEGYVDASEFKQRLQTGIAAARTTTQTR